MKDLIADIIVSLEELKDEQRIQFSKTSYPTSMRMIGVVSANEKKVLKELKAITKNYSNRQKIDLAVALGQTKIFECQHLGFEYLGRDKKARTELSTKDLDRLLTVMDNWVSVDCYGVYIAGYAYRENIIGIDSLLKFYKSDNFWMRRIPIVATVTLNMKSQGGTGDVNRTLEICEWAVDDHADMINKALSWAIRQLIIHDRDAVLDFIETYESRLHRRVLREVRNKLETGRKY
ncbi:MAG: DNA alkylation repair protein [Bacteroidales bacterium]|nr:DNA alkylation repair protein [Bacteroidales bacterium]